MSNEQFDKLVDDALSTGDLSVHLPVRLDVLSDHELYLDAAGGLAGIFIATRYPSKVGTALTLDVRLSWGEGLVVEGSVEWVREVSRATLRIRRGMGVRFDHLIPHARTLLNRALLLRQPIPVPADAVRS